jgi:hypothetical protein
MREFSLFSFTLGAFAFFALFLLPVLFWLRARECEKAPPPTSTHDKPLCFVVGMMLAESGQ